MSIGSLLPSFTVCSLKSSSPSLRPTSLPGDLFPADGGGLVRLRVGGINNQRVALAAPAVNSSEACPKVQKAKQNLDAALLPNKPSQSTFTVIYQCVITTIAESPNGRGRIVTMAHEKRQRCDNIEPLSGCDVTVDCHGRITRLHDLLVPPRKMLQRSRAKHVADKPNTFV